MIRPISIATCALFALSLVGCGSATYSGSVNVSWRDGGGSDTGEACVCAPSLLAMQVEEVGDARVTGGWWTVVQTPPGAVVGLSDANASEIVATFDVAGWYTLDYTVEYGLGFSRYTTSSRLYLHAMPAGAG